MLELFAPDPADDPLPETKVATSAEKRFSRLRDAVGEELLSYLSVALSSPEKYLTPLPDSRVRVLSVGDYRLVIELNAPHGGPGVLGVFHREELYA